MEFLDKKTPEGGAGPELEPAAQAAPIGLEQIQKASETLQRYRAGKANLEKRIIDNEQWWKLRHWSSMNHGGANDPKPTSGWLVNVCLSKHADAMDAFPEANMLPREPGDREEAQMLSDIIPVIHAKNDFEGTWSDSWWKKIKAGVGIVGVFWDQGKLNGMGDITTKEIDPLNLFWEPGVTDIQESRHLFSVQLVNNERLQELYPQLEGKLGAQSEDISKYIYDDSVDTTDKSLVVDWYYKKAGLLQYCKYVRGHVLYASENDPALAEKGWYDHGKYPFVFDVMFPEEGTPAGYGYIDLCKDAQEQIDLMNNAILKNTLMGATPRWFVNNAGSVNEEEYLDVTKPFVHYSGNRAEDSVYPIQATTLSAAHIACLDRKIEEMKETSGNRDVSNGGTTQGVTAASAIAAMQEQSGKLSRDQIQNSYRAYRAIVELEIELIRQFYNQARKFRITGRMGEEQFVTYDNRGIRMQPVQVEGAEIGLRRPVFDIEVTAQRSSSYSKMANNELALQFYGKGFFDPRMADQALAALDMMEFRGKESVVQRISQNGTLMQQLMQTQMQLVSALQMLDQLQGSSLAESFVAQQTGQPAPMAAAAAGDTKTMDTDSLGATKEEEHAVVQKARQRTQESTQPR